MEQPYYNRLSREGVEKEAAEIYACIGITVFRPLAGGVLTGKYSGGVIPPGSRQVPMRDARSTVTASTAVPLCP